MSMLNTIQTVFEKLKSDPFARDLFGAMAGCFIMIGFIELGLEFAISRHWSLGIFLILISGLLLTWVVLQTRYFGPHYAITLVILHLLVSVTLGTVFFAGISYLFYKQGIASYRVTNGSGFIAFRNFYFWTFLDILPLVEVCGRKDSNCAIRWLMDLHERSLS